MSERRLEAALREAQAPDELAAERRAWGVVSAALAAREPVAAPRRAVRALAIGVALAALLAAALSPPGAAMLGSLRDAVARGIGVEEAGPLLLELPAAGRLLVDSPSGAWVVHEDGSKRLLADAADATWSPQGLFVGAARGRELVALTPEGVTRWTIPHESEVREPRWAPSGYRIAYLAGSELRVTAADGTGDRSLAAPVPGVAPAWRPGDAHVLAFAARNGRIRVVDTDTGETLLRSRPGPAPVELAWSADGTVLAALDRAGVRLLEPGGGTRRVGLGGRTGVSLAAAPGRPAFAVVVRDEDAGRSEALLLRTGARGLRTIFAGAGSFSGAAWSPDGDWLLVAWASADQWVFVRSAGVERLEAVSDVARQFRGSEDAPAGFPDLRGWCCPAEVGPDG